MTLIIKHIFWPQRRLLSHAERGVCGLFQSSVESALHPEFHVRSSWWIESVGTQRVGLHVWKLEGHAASLFWSSDCCSDLIIFLIHSLYDSLLVSLFLCRLFRPFFLKCCALVFEAKA